MIDHSPFVLFDSTGNGIHLPLSEWDTELEVPSVLHRTLAGSGTLDRPQRRTPRTWNLRTKLDMPKVDQDRLRALWETSPGPYWFYDGTRPSALPADARLMTSWYIDAEPEVPEVGKATPEFFIQSPVSPASPGPYAIGLGVIGSVATYNFVAMNSAGSVIASWDLNSSRTIPTGHTIVTLPTGTTSVQFAGVITNTVWDPVIVPLATSAPNGQEHGSICSVVIDSFEEELLTLDRRSLTLELTRTN